MQFVIRIPNGRQITLGAYVAGWRTIKAMVAAGDGDHDVRGWGHFPERAARILRDLQYGLHDRINQRGGIVVRESRVHPSYWHHARAPRVILEPHMVRSMPPSARRRFTHRIRDPLDY